MTSHKKKTSARHNVRAAAPASTGKQTFNHLPKKTKTALGKEGAEAR